VPLFFVIGPPGSGKTRFSKEFSDGINGLSKVKCFQDLLKDLPQRCLNLTISLALMQPFEEEYLNKGGLSPVILRLLHKFYCFQIGRADHDLKAFHEEHLQELKDAYHDPGTFIRKLLEKAQKKYFILTIDEVYRDHGLLKNLLIDVKALVDNTVNGDGVKVIRVIMTGIGQSALRDSSSNRIMLPIQLPLLNLKGIKGILEKRSDQLQALINWNSADFNKLNIPKGDRIPFLYSFLAHFSIGLPRAVESIRLKLKEIEENSKNFTLFAFLNDVAVQLVKTSSYEITELSLLLSLWGKSLPVKDSEFPYTTDPRYSSPGYVANFEGLASAGGLLLSHRDQVGDFPVPYLAPVFLLPLYLPVRSDESVTNLSMTTSTEFEDVFNPPIPGSSMESRGVENEPKLTVPVSSKPLQTLLYQIINCFDGITPKTFERFNLLTEYLLRFLRRELPSFCRKAYTKNYFLKFRSASIYEVYGEGDSKGQLATAQLSEVKFDFTAALNEIDPPNNKTFHDQIPTLAQCIQRPADFVNNVYVMDESNAGFEYCTILQATNSPKGTPYYFLLCEQHKFTYRYGIKQGGTEIRTSWEKTLRATNGWPPARVILIFKTNRSPKTFDPVHGNVLTLCNPSLRVFLGETLHNLLETFSRLGGIHDDPNTVVPN
jgi:hypothetical protein